MVAIKQKNDLGPVPRDKKDFLRLLRANGYILKRTGVHDLYEDERGHRVHVSQGAFMHPGIIKKAYLAMQRGYNRVNNTEEPVREVVFEEPVKRESTKIYNNAYAKGFKNTPTVVEDKVEDKVESKLFGLGQREECLRLAANGMSQTAIAELLTKQGYTLARGGPVAQTVVSRVMRGFEPSANGPKRKDPDIRAKDVTPRKRATKSTLVDDLQDIITSNLSDELKRKFIMTRVQEET